MIITLCGSARFEPVFHVWNEVLTLSGHVVFGLAVYPSSKKGKKNWYSEDEKRILDVAHFKKIAASHAILVLNRFAYIGESTLNEIECAKNLNKKLYAIESWGEGNGIGSHHFDSVQKLAKKYGCLGVGSPISTCSPEFNEPGDLLPPAGPFRSSLVNKINKVKL